MSARKTKYVPETEKELHVIHLMMHEINNHSTDLSVFSNVREVFRQTGPFQTHLYNVSVPEDETRSGFRQYRNIPLTREGRTFQLESFRTTTWSHMVDRVMKVGELPRYFMDVMPMRGTTSIFHYLSKRSALDSESGSESD